MFKVIVFITSILCLTATAGQMSIIENGKPLFEIIYPENSAKAGECVYPPVDNPKKGKILANFIADYFQESTGSRPMVILDGEQRNKSLAIHCGMTAYARKLNLPLASMDEDEFIIAFPDDNNIVIAGKYQNGIEYGTVDFLERFLGIKWLFPGKLGTCIPQYKNLRIPTVTIRKKPVFLNRNISFNNNRKELTKWSRLSRLRRRIKYHHFVGVIFNPKIHCATHPEYYPVLKGKRVKPESLIAWQPCYSAPGIVDNAANYIIKYFKSHPNRSTISLAANDNGGYCECDKCLAVDGRKKNYMGYPNRSRSYYKFCTAVANKVTKILPKRSLKFGLLAYREIAIFPQGEEIAKNIIPFYTTDLMRWLDQEIKNKDVNELKKWTSNVNDVAVYDYAYGGLYSMPRIYFHHMATYLRKLNSLGIRYYTAETYITKNYREGPKFYLLMKLLWNPNIDVDKVLQNWYIAAVGPKAAPLVANYFKLWENFWTKTVPKGKWFNESKHSLYLDYTSNDYYYDIKAAELDKMETLLRAALKVTDNKLAKQRVQLWLKGFLDTKILVMTRKIGKKINAESFKSEAVRTIVNNDFTTDRQWASWKNKASFAKFSYDKKSGHDKPGCIMIDKSKDANQPTPPDAVFMKRIKVRAGMMYRLSVWVKTSEVKAAVTEKKEDISITVRWREKDGKTWVHFVGLKFVKHVTAKNGQWQKIVMNIPAPRLDNIYYAVILLGTNVCTGMVRFDDFKMVEIKNKDEIEQQDSVMTNMEDMLKSGKIINIAPFHSFENINDLKKSGYSIWPPKIRPSATLSKDDGSDGKQCVMFNNAPIDGSINRFFRRVKPGDKYYVAVDYKKINGGRCSVNILWRDNKSFFPSNSPYNSTFYSKPLINQWATMGGIVTVPPKATILVYAVSVKRSPGNDDICLFDNFRVCKLK